MNPVGDLPKESIKSLGPGAYLVSVLPSVVLILTLFALVSSRLYPWSSALQSADGPVRPGVESIVYSVEQLGIAGGIVLSLAVLVVAVLLRPLQISAVQLLEGYWDRGGSLGAIESMAIERHARRWRRHTVLRRLWPDHERSFSFDDVARRDRLVAAAERRRARATVVLSRYPRDVGRIMPTLLGNVLRRAETTSGERYGLDTVTIYPRLYPHLSPRLDIAMANQLDVIDSASTFVFVLSIQAAASAPLVVRLDWWSLVPAMFAVLAFVSYRGATAAAGKQGQLLATAFDLHRFDMLTAMHRRLPAHAAEELADNLQLSAFVRNGEPLGEADRSSWTYSHPAPVDTLVTGGAGASASAPPDQHDLASAPENVDDHGA
jgi:hypothetical protein